MPTPSQILRQVHLEAQEAVDALWDILVLWDGRLPKSHLVQIRQKREPVILQSYCFEAPEHATLFLQMLIAQARGVEPPSGAESLQLEMTPTDYVFKEIEPPKRPRKAATKDVPGEQAPPSDSAPKRGKSSVA